MKKTLVNIPNHEYEILIGEGLIDYCAQYVKSAVKAESIMIISDTNVAPIYLEKVEKSLEDAGLRTAAHIFPAGEKYKTIDTVVAMVEDLADEKLSRTDCVIALGGGVCGDMAGFASAMYMRGIDFIQISTSLLSDIDSSVGGKTGCDLENGKNLAGAFHQPKLVLIDTNTLNTLPKKYLIDGMGEMIKYGVIRSGELFERIEQNPDNAVNEDNIFECVDIKRQIVENDEFEHGERKLLNFGHTLGHAIEKYYNFEQFSHGESVTIGMVMMSKVAEKHGLCESGTTQRIVDIAKRIGLPTICDADLSELLKIAQSDKKRRGSTMDIILPKKIGDAFVYTLQIDEMEDFFSVI